MYDSIEYKKQLIKDIKKILENKGLSATAKIGMLSELRALEESISLLAQVKHGTWVIKTAKNMYYQFNRFEKIARTKLSRVVLSRNGDEFSVGVDTFNTEYRLATPTEGKEHENFLRMKMLKSVNYGVGTPKAFDPMKCDFYMVTCTGIHGSKVRHASYGEAETEAIRIAKKSNHEAWIVGVVASVKPTLGSSKIAIRKH